MTGRKTVIKVVVERNFLLGKYKCPCIFATWIHYYFFISTNIIFKN